MTGSKSAVWHPFWQHGLKDDIPLIDRAEGALLYGADGREWIDAISSWWVTTHGHCHPRIMAAIANQAQKLDQLIFAGWTHEPAEKLASRLVEITPAPLRHVFFSDSGSTSVEVALKMALGYWANMGEARSRIITMQGSYHGDTIGAMSIGQRGVFNAAYAPLLFDACQIPFPHEGAEQASLNALEAACREKPAALIVEPLISGAGGMLIYSADILQQMRAICAAHNVIFIADEVMTGWGRTGVLFACNHAGIAPDIMCLSKGLTGGSLPLAVTLASEAIFDAHYSQERAKMFYHSSSYTANPLACAAANANLDVWDEEPVMERIAALSALQTQHLNALAEHPKIGNIRQLGTIAAFDIQVDNAGYLSDIAPRIMRHMRENGVLLRPLGNTVYTMPPYCISEMQLERIYALIAKAMDKLTFAD